VVSLAVMAADCSVVVDFNDCTRDADCPSGESCNPQRHYCEVPAVELCNGVDDDCDGAIDEGVTQGCYTGASGTSGVGVCRAGTQTCAAGAWSACVGQVVPATETCNNLDDDCDGTIDDGVTQGCYTGAAGTGGVGVCRPGTQACSAGAWGACTGQTLPGTETCNNLDDNCNGAIDDGVSQGCYTGPAGSEARGACRAGTQTCAPIPGGSAWGGCTGEITPAARDLCDGVDRDCNGTANDGCTCAIGANRLCYTGPSGTQSVGICRSGTQPCVRGADGVSTTWGGCINEVRPAAAEVCANGLDDNCNGMVDEGCPPPSTTCPTGQPRCGGVCCAAGEACAANICVGNGQLRFTLTWDVMADLDLHVVPPCGTEIYYGNLSSCGGTLDRDSCPALRATDGADRCNGPENIFWPSAPASGTYLVCVNPWQMNSGSTARWTLNVYRGTMLIRTFTGTRNSSVSYVRCTRTAASFVGEITI